MSLEIGILFALLAVMVVLFLTEKLPVDLTAFAGLVVLVFAGYVKPEEAFAGFASNAVITMLSVFFVSAALQYTGVASAMGARIHKVVGSREIPLIIAIMLVSGVLSAFMITLGRRLLPKGAGMAETERTNLASVYGVEEHLFCLGVPPASPLAGKSLADVGLANILGVQVVAIERDGEELPAPKASEVLREGDRLVVQGQRRDLEDRLDVQGLEV